MSDALGANLTEGMVGTDNGHDFRVTQVDRATAEIRYEEDGETARFMTNRFRFKKGILQLE